MTETRDAAIEREQVNKLADHVAEQVETFLGSGTVGDLGIIIKATIKEWFMAGGWNARTTDLARLLEAMRRDAVESLMPGCVVYIRMLKDGSGYVRLDHGEPATFDTIEAGAKQLRTIIDDAEEGK
jgi:hypothetical protein